MEQKTNHYRMEDGYRLIDVAIQDLDLLFSPMDPSPPPERDLDSSTEDYILGALSEIGSKYPVKLVFHIPPAQLSATDGSHFSSTIRNYFAYRAWANRMALNRLLRLGCLSLLIGIVFLIVCILVRRFLTQHLEGELAPIFGTGFDIIGWVAMWRPIEIFLYDWWPLALNRNRFLRLSVAPIELKTLKEDPQLWASFRRQDRPAHSSDRPPPSNSPRP